MATTLVPVERVRTGRKENSREKIQAVPSQPWQRQHRETGVAFQAFLAFRNQSPRRRSLIAAYRATHPGAVHLPGRWQVWLERWRWHERVRAWDRHIEAEAERRAGEPFIRDRAAALLKAAQLAVILGDRLCARLEAAPLSSLIVIRKVVHPDGTTEIERSRQEDCWRDCDVFLALLKELRLPDPKL